MGYTFHKDIDSSAASSVIETDSIHRIGQVGSSLAPPISLLMPFTGSTDPVVHLGSLTGSAKVVCESRLGHL